MTRHKEQDSATPSAPEAVTTTPETQTNAPQPPNDPSTSNREAGIAQPVGAYAQRELHFIQREEAGALRFAYIKNDGEPQHMIWLTHLKNIYSKQLPNMPKEYIVRLVFERRHRSVGIVTPENQCIGGITFRTFPGTGNPTLGEIAFCAVSATHQVKGFGTRLMNWTKEHARTHDRLTHFLTYADNNAVGYFAKQGFTKKITLDKELWFGYIKDYDGGTLMECVIHPRICYAQLPAMVRAQREALEGHLRNISNSHVVHAPLCAPDETFRARDIRDIPGVVGAGYTGRPPPSYQLLIGTEAVPPSSDALQRFQRHLLAALRAQEQIWPFLEPVDINDAPDYYTCVKDPVDVAMIQRRVDAGDYYVTLEIFLAEVKRIWANARLYNREDTIYYKLADQLEEWVHTYLITHLQHSS